MISVLVDMVIDYRNWIIIALGVIAFVVVRYSFGEWLAPNARRRLAEGWTPRQLALSYRAVSLLGAGLVMSLAPSTSIWLLVMVSVVALAIAAWARWRAAFDLWPWCGLALIVVLLERAAISIYFPAWVP